MYPLTYFSRHGLTQWNVEFRFQGSQDTLLNEVGKRQADENGRRLPELLELPLEQFDFVSSPMKRTRETMERLRRGLGLDPHSYRTDHALKEICYGDWEGKTIEEMVPIHADGVKAREKNKWNFTPPGENGESYEDLAQRLDGWLQTLDKPTICVLHGGNVRCLFQRLGIKNKYEAANMHVPQDKILRLKNNSLDWI